MAILRVNTTTAAGASGATVNATAASHTAKNFLVVFITDEGTGVLASPNGVTDTAGNTYTVLPVSYESTGSPPGMGSAWLAYAYNITGHASNVVTAHFSSNATYCCIIVAQYSGILTTDPIDVSNKGGSGGSAVAAFSAPGITTTTAGDLLVGFAFNNSGVAATWTSPSGEVLDSIGNVATLSEQIGVATATYTLAGTWASATNWATYMAAFKPAASGPSGSPGSIHMTITL